MSFLVGFDVNLWALDLEMRTALQVAGAATRADVVDCLDKAMARQELTNRYVDNCKSNEVVNAEDIW